MAANLEFDNVDLKILALLMEDANMAYTEVAKKVFVSGGTVHVRMKKLEEMGIVKGAQLRVDYTKLGYDIIAFLGIFLDKNSMYNEVAKYLDEIPEVINTHYTTGDYSIFAKIICKDTNHLRRVLHDKVQRIPGVQRTETLISLEERIDRAIQLDIDDPSFDLKSIKAEMAKSK